MALPGKRDLKYLGLCLVAAGLFSTCGKRQYFAIIVGPDGRTCGTGYNGSPPGMAHCVDGACPRFQEDSPPGSNYDNCIAIHAEQNALIWSDRTARTGGTIYVNGTPCMTCARLIAGSGLSRVVYIEDDTYAGWPQVKDFLIKNGIRCAGYTKIACQDRLNGITI